VEFLELIHDSGNKLIDDVLIPLNADASRRYAFEISETSWAPDQQAQGKE
jgi:hypothetical protein